LLSHSLFIKCSNLIPTYSISLESYTELLKRNISDKNILSVCGDNIALLNTASKIDFNPSTNDYKEALFKAFVKTEDCDKLIQIYRLCVLGTYEYSISIQNLGYPHVDSGDLNTLKVFDSYYYAGHKYKSLNEAKKLFNKAFCFVSDNDPYVPQNMSIDFSNQLSAKINTISNGGHFNKNAGYTEFYELLKVIEDNG